MKLAIGVTETGELAQQFHASQAFAIYTIEDKTITNRELRPNTVVIDQAEDDDHECCGGGHGHGHGHHHHGEGEEHECCGGGHGHGHGHHHHGEGEEHECCGGGHGHGHGHGHHHHGEGEEHECYGTRAARKVIEGYMGLLEGCNALLTGSIHPRLADLFFHNGIEPFMVEGEASAEAIANAWAAQNGCSCGHDHNHEGHDHGGHSCCGGH